MFPPEILPECYRSTAFIAGGFAACPALATDLDVWVPAGSASEWRTYPRLLEDARATVLEHLEAGIFLYTAEPPRVRPNAGLDADNYPVGVMKVARIEWKHLSHPIHIMVVAGTAQEVIDGFDISTHMVALTPGGVLKGRYWTSIMVPPDIVKMTPGTPERMAKIAARFGHPSPYSITEPR